MILFLRIVQYATYPFLALSALLWMGTGFGAAFVTDFVVENRTGQVITVTPVGAVGRHGNRWPLPIVMLEFPSIPSLHRGGYLLQPDESVTIKYDMDDINFSELVIEDEKGRFLQIVTDPEPTENQYHSPLRDDFVIGELAGLQEATPAVKRAAECAKEPRTGAMIVLSLMFGPWFVFGLVSWQRKRVERRSILHPGRDDSD